MPSVAWLPGIEQFETPPPKAKPAENVILPAAPEAGSLRRSRYQFWSGPSAAKKRRSGGRLSVMLPGAVFLRAPWRIGGGLRCWVPFPNESAASCRPIPSGSKS